MDRLSAVMLLVVTGIGALIHIYAIGYMSHEGGYYRFFAYMNLFMFFMLTLVLGANYLVLFVGWEGVGLCSYLLIGFYFLKKSATNAGKKAFVVNRIGDFGFSLAMFLIVMQFGSLDFQQVFAKAAGLSPEKGAGMLTLICLLLMVGATGKSAQVPLYVWLPDAMEGPTPVSALIHAATMVTAGVYMVARSATLFTHAPIAMEVVAISACSPPCWRRRSAWRRTTSKRSLPIRRSRSSATCSSASALRRVLGGHLPPHDARLLQGAAVPRRRERDSRALRRAGSAQHGRATEEDPGHVLQCCFAPRSPLPACRRLSGFYSKDAILVAAYPHAPWMYWVGVVTAGMTAFYVFRAIFLCFFGEYRGEAHPHESPLVMTAPLGILALLSLAGGFINVPRFLEPIFGELHEVHDESLVFISVAAGLIGIALAFLFYVVKPGMADSLANALGGVYRLVLNKYYVDEAYDAAIVSPLVDGSRTVLWRGVDSGFIDGIVNGAGSSAGGAGAILRHLQSGYIRRYAAWVLVGAIVLIAVGSFAGGLK